MRQLGISLYPDTSDLEADIAYLKLARKYGYNRIFTSLLQVVGDSETGTLAKFKKTIKAANDLGYKVIVDINPALFKDLDISYTDLHFFNDLGVWGIRLDEGFTGLEEAQMTRNPYGLKIEINMSAGTNYMQSIMSYHPLRDNLLGCHNFYPQAYTGLSDEKFVAYSKPYREENLHTAAFVTSAVATQGPWPVSEGLPSMESDRNRPITTQVQHLKMTGMIDDIIIANAYASEEELAAVAASFNAPMPELHVDLADDVTEVERQIVVKGIDGKHLYRGDASDYLLRSTLPRIEYSKSDIPSRNQSANFKRGDVIVVNNDYSRYKGEMQIALSEFPNDGRRNVVGHITDADMVLLDALEPWMTFALKAE